MGDVARGFASGLLAATRSKHTQVKGQIALPLITVVSGDFALTRFRVSSGGFTHLGAGSQFPSCRLSNRLTKIVGEARKLLANP
jgi:hypothetical protein